MDLLWFSGTNSGTNVGGTIGFDVSADDTGSLSYLGDFVALHTEEWIEFDLQSATAIDSFSLMFDPVEGPELSATSVVKLQANSVSSWAAPPIDITLTFDTVYQIFTHFFTAAETYQFWRILIVDPDNAKLNVGLSKIILSNATQLTQNPEIGFSDTERDQR